jgi:Methylamine utilisation protein MauE
MVTFCTLFLVGVFAWSGSSKVASRARFRTGLLTIPWLPPRYASVVGAVVPTAELGVVPTLLAFPRVGATVASALLCAFTAVLAIEVRAGRNFSCGCFGAVASESVGWETMARNAILLVGCVPIVVRGAESARLGAVLTGLGLAGLLLLFELTASTMRAARSTT